MPQIHGTMLIVYIGGLDTGLSDRSRGYLHFPYGCRKLPETIKFKVGFVA